MSYVACYTHPGVRTGFHAGGSCCERILNLQLQKYKIKTFMSKLSLCALQISNENVGFQVDKAQRKQDKFNEVTNELI